MVIDRYSIYRYCYINCCQRMGVWQILLPGLVLLIQMYTHASNYYNRFCGIGNHDAFSAFK